MYLLPVTTYFDYVQAGKRWTKWTGGTILLSFLLGTPQSQKAKEGQMSVNPWVEIRADGLTREVSTSQSDPADIVRKAGAALGPNDIVSVGGKTIEIIRVEERLILVDTDLPFSTETRVDAKQAPGTSKVLTTGSTGIKRDIVKITLAGGREVGRETVFSQVVQEPVKKVVATNPVRSVNKTAVARGQVIPPGIQASAVMTFETTAYTYTGHNTATGLRPRVGLVAVDPQLIPLGTKMYIEGYGFAMAADTGGAIKGKIVDVFFETVRECLVWGRRKAKIYILAP